MFWFAIERFGRVLISAFAILVAQAMVRHLLDGRYSREYFWPIVIALSVSLLALVGLWKPARKLSERWLWTVPLGVLTIVAFVIA